MSRTLENRTCSFCGCLCDDIAVTVDNGRIESVKKACPNGRGLFLDYDPTPRPHLVDGKETGLDEAVKAAAQVLKSADYPLIYGLSSSAVEAQRKAVALADRLGAVLDSTSSVCHGPSGLAMQNVGEVSCSLGEVKNRADFVVFWGCNPAESHVRHLARYSLSAKGMLTQGGRKDRYMAVADVRPTATSKMADLFLQIRPGCDFEVLTALRALIRERPVHAGEVGGVPVSTLKTLAEKMKSCRYGTAFMGMGLTMNRGRDRNVAELFTLVAELNDYTRFTVMPMRGHGNVAGADQVATWQTGYPFAINFSRGYPRYGPGEFTAVDVLARREADAALILASDPAAHFPRAAAEHLKTIPVVAIDACPSMTTALAKVAFFTACYGVDAEGTSYRMDNFPIRMRPALTRQRPTDEEVLDQILKAVS
jgi:formylmethanofuran dehydrogenase subunit B